MTITRLRDAESAKILAVIALCSASGNPDEVLEAQRAI